jgi:hypothetical protein
MSDNVETLNNENSLDRFISDNKMFYIKWSRLKIEQCGAVLVLH